MKIKQWFNLQFLKIILYFRKYKRVPGKLTYDPGMIESPVDGRDYDAAKYVGSSMDMPDFYALPIEANKFVKNQGSWNSCASHAMCTAVEILHKIKGTNLQVPLSERHHYWVARQDKINGVEYQGNFPENDGMYSRTMLKVAQNIGLTPEKLCPYQFP